MTNPIKQSEQPDPWNACTWDGAREDVLRRGQTLSFREKLVWLEHAARLSQRFQIDKSRSSHSLH